MRIGLSITFVSLIIGLTVCMIIARKSKKPIGKTLSILILALIPPVLGNLFIISSPIEVLSYVGCYIYFLGMNFVVIALLRFTYEYCNLKLPGWVRAILHAVLVLDSLQLLLNIWTHHAFSLTKIEVYGGEFWKIVPYWGQTIHRIIDYIIFGAAVVIFLVKTIRSPKVYAEKYFVIILAMAAIGLWQTFYVISGVSMDFSMIGYGIFGVLVFLLSLFYRPLRLLDRMLAAIASRMPEALFFFDTNKRCIWVNNQARELLNITDEDLEKVPFLLQEKFVGKIQDATDWSDRYQVGQGDEMKSYVLECQKVVDDRNKLVGAYLSVRDNTSEQKAIIRESYNATHDELTKVYNRAGYNKALKKVDLKSVFLLLLDIDLFKETNDKYGHKVGDQVLELVAAVITKHFRDTDSICRIGGDEFAIIIPEANELTSKLVKDRINSINKELSKGKHNLPVVTISSGGAYGNNVSNESELFNNADTALYQTKSTGRCGFTLFE